MSVRLRRVIQTGGEKLYPTCFNQPGITSRGLSLATMGLDGSSESLRIGSSLYVKPHPSMADCSLGLDCARSCCILARVITSRVSLIPGSAISMRPSFRYPCSEQATVYFDADVPLTTCLTTVYSTTAQATTDCVAVALDRHWDGFLQEGACSSKVGAFRYMSIPIK